MVKANALAGKQLASERQGFDRMMAAIQRLLATRGCRS